MITPYLEKLIHEGKARWKHWTVGIGGVMTLPVQQDCFIVIEKFTFSPFLDTRQQNAYTAIAAANRCIHTLKFYPNGKGREYYYNFRTSFNLNAVGNAILPLPVANEHVQDCYMLFGSNVNIDCWLFNPPPNWAGQTVAPYSSLANEPEPPAGYGTVINAVKAVDTPDGQYMPATIRRTDVAPGSYREQAFFDVSNATALFPIPLAGEQSSFQFPLLNISFVEVYEKAPTTIQ
jgi:hypothetical protein